MGCCAYGLVSHAAQADEITVIRTYILSTVGPIKTLCCSDNNTVSDAYFIITEGGEYEEEEDVEGGRSNFAPDCLT